MRKLARRQFLPRDIAAGIGLALVSLSVLAQSQQPLERSGEDAMVPSVAAPQVVHVVGNDGMKQILDALNRLFKPAHPAVTFEMDLHGSSTAIPALTEGRSAFAPMGRDAWSKDLDAFKKKFGYLPVDIRIGYSGWGPRPPFKTPPAVYVNKSNTLPGLTLEQLRQIFVTDDTQQPLTDWPHDDHQAPRPIHLYGLGDKSGFAAAFRTAHFNGLPFNARYHALQTPTDVMQAIADDPDGIGFVGWVDPDKVTNRVRLLPLAWNKATPYALPTQADLEASRYPVVSYLHIYVNKVPGHAVAPWLVDYLRLILSEQGQAAIATSRDTAEGYLPLAEAERPQERGKVDALASP